MGDVLDVLDLPLALRVELNRSYEGARHFVIKW